MFYDERGYYISERELYQSYEELKANKETECETFEEYVRECCSQNGTLTKVKGD